MFHIFSKTIISSESKWNQRVAVVEVSHLEKKIVELIKRHMEIKFRSIQYHSFTFRT